MATHISIFWRNFDRRLVRSKEALEHAVHLLEPRNLVRVDERGDARPARLGQSVATEASVALAIGAARPKSREMGGI